MPSVYELKTALFVAGAGYCPGFIQNTVHVIAHGNSSNIKRCEWVAIVTLVVVIIAVDILRREHNQFDIIRTMFVRVSRRSFASR